MMFGTSLRKAHASFVMCCPEVMIQGNLAATLLADKEVELPGDPLSMIFLAPGAKHDALRSRTVKSS